MPKRQRQSTKTDNSYTGTRHNAIKHGVLSRVPVLPWEDAAELTQLQDALIKEYNPQGASEEHLICEMANCIFRKQRLYTAENALIMKSMTVESSYTLRKAVNLLMPNTDLATVQLCNEELDRKSALYHDGESFQQDGINEQKHYLKEVQKVIDSNFSYEEMLKRCPAAAVDIWHEWLVDPESDYTPDQKSFKTFLDVEIIQWCEMNATEIQARPYLKQQLIGLAYVPNHDTDQLQRHEISLDRRFEKSLSMLLRLQELRAMRADTIIVSQPANSVL